MCCLTKMRLTRIVGTLRLTRDFGVFVQHTPPRCKCSSPTSVEGVEQRPRGAW